MVHSLPLPLLLNCFLFIYIFVSGLTGITCELHQLAGTLSSKQLTPLLEAASVFSRKPPPISAGVQQSGDGETRLGSSFPESFRPSSFEKDIKVGSFEKSLSPNDLRAIHEMLNQRNSRSSSSLLRLEAEAAAEREKEKAEKEKAEKERVEKEKTSSLLSEDSTLSDDSDDDLFFECNDDIPGAIASLKSILVFSSLCLFPCSSSLHSTSPISPPFVFFCCSS